jgi:hypothetical protein
VNYTVGSPQGLATGDVNGDGRLDLVAANVNNSSVSVLLGIGNGTFAAASHFPAGTGPSTVALADFNADTRLDVVVGNFYADTVSVLLGSGDGNFGAPQSFTVGPGPLSVATGDFNGDSRPDVVAVNYQQATPSAIGVLIGNGDGTLGQLRSYATGVGPSSVAVADFDGDGNAGQRRRHPPGADQLRRGERRHLRGDRRPQRRYEAGPGDGQLRRRHCLADAQHQRESPSGAAADIQSPRRRLRRIGHRLARKRDRRRDDSFHDRRERPDDGLADI